MTMIPISLTLQERTILDRLARGYHTEEISTELSMGKTALIIATRIIRTKLGAKTTMQAVARAVHERLILPFDGDPREFNGRIPKTGKEN